MNRKLSDGNIFRTVKSTLGFAGLATLALLSAGSTRAQSKPAQTETAAARPTAAAPEASPGPALSGPTFATAQAAAQNSPAKPSAPKGDFEGIKVHGHWVIEVKNPDGKVVTRREFENAIQPFGATYLAALLAGNNSPGGLAILLNGANSFFLLSDFVDTLQFKDSGPCLPSFAINTATGTPFSVTGGPGNGTTCLIANPTSTLGFVCYRAQAVNASTNSPSPCSTLLTTTAPTLNAYDSGNEGIPVVQMVLSGSVLVSSSVPGNVNDAETVFTACDTNTTPTGCLHYFNPLNPQAAAAGIPAQTDFFTMRKLDGQGDDPAAVPYTPGQSITATVTISFQ